MATLPVTECYLSDNASLRVAVAHPLTKVQFDCAGKRLISTFKRYPADADEDALIQKISDVGGITVYGVGDVSVDLVPADSDALLVDSRYHWDIRSQDLVTGERLVVYRGIFIPRSLCTHDMLLSIPTYTTTPAALYTFLANRVDVPAASNSTGTAGQWAEDSDYHYRCVATNTWRRYPLNDW
jgi:hypothetical protein